MLVLLFALSCVQLRGAEASVPSAFNTSSTNELCKIAMSCMVLGSNDTIMRAEQALRDGADPNRVCTKASFRSEIELQVTHLLVMNNCHEMLRRLLELREVPHPIEVNSEWLNRSGRGQFRANALALISISLAEPIEDTLRTLDVLLNEPRLNVNSKSSRGQTSLEMICGGFTSFDSSSSNLFLILDKFWQFRARFDHLHHRLLLELCGNTELQSVLGNATSLHASAALYSDISSLKLRHISLPFVGHSMNDSHIIAHSALCKLALGCRRDASNEHALESAQSLLRAGVDPNGLCSRQRGSDYDIVHVIVQHRCAPLLQNLTAFGADVVRHPIAVNSRFKGRPLNGSSLHLAAFFTLDSVFADDGDNFATLNVLLHNPNVDVNEASSQGNVMELFCKNLASYPSFFRSFLFPFFFKLWSHQALNDAQRELILDRCSDARLLLEHRSQQRFWEFSVTDNDDDINVDYLRAVSGARPDELKLPMKIVGLRAQDEGGVVPRYLQQLVATALSGPLAEHVRLQFDAKLFAPAPSSLTVDVATFVALTERMRTLGILIGASLNTLFFSSSLFLDAPLDRVVLQRLIDPSSPIAVSDALNSAVCSAASTLSDPEELWPALDVDEDAVYCVALVERLLSTDASPAFNAMLDGFRATIPEGQRSHHFPAAFAHRLLTQAAPRVTLPALLPRLRFVTSLPHNVTTVNEMFLSVLVELASDDPGNLSRFLLQVSGSAHLRQSDAAVPITISWITPNATANKVLAHTCISTLSLPLLEDKQLLKSVMQDLVSPAHSERFDTA